MSADKLNEAIAAFQAGDRPNAKALFQEVISADPNNDTAWYYFAALQDDPARRRAALNRVLEINPGHERARDVLASMDAAQAAAPAAPPASARPRAATTPPPVEPVNVTPPSPAPRAASSGAGFAIPGNIPGAPQRATFGELWNEWLELFIASINVLMRKPGVYEQEIARGSWWRFWLLVGGVAAISALLSLIGSILFGSGILFGLISAIVTLILTPGIAYAGVWLSHFWAARQGSPVPQ
ncbi:MAG TPA: tetratricopeptide repeat protein, partial [Candidatus Limnocylindrales bacterium]|nr:tetratricopeptide repeat protein [Candidatus Limnocylindrales bacterium]